MLGGAMAMVMTELFAVAGVAQVALLVTTTSTTWPLVRLLVT